MKSVAKEFIEKTISKETRELYIRYLLDSEADPQIISFFKNLESFLERYFRESHSGLPSAETIKRLFEFDSDIRRHFLSEGGKLVLSSFSEGSIPREYSRLFDLTIDQGFDLTFGTVDSIQVCHLGGAGRAKVELFRIQGIRSYLDFIWGQESAHIVRFIGDKNEQGTLSRLRDFRRMVSVLLQAGAKIITGKAAAADDPSVRMGEGGNWRFESLPTDWNGISVSRLEKLWMRVGFIPERLLGIKSSKMALLSSENALILLDEFKANLPDSPIPFQYLCPKVSIYDHATLLKLKE